MNSRPKSANTTIKSEFQRNFETRQTFKRNKHYINLEDLNHIEKQYQLRRRKPIKSEDEQVSKKISQSFVVSTAQLTERQARSSRNQHRSRTGSVSIMGPLSSRGEINGRNLTFSQVNQARFFDEESPTENKIIEKPQKNIRSFSMDKMTSREYHHNLKNKPVPDQRLFNNYQQLQLQVPLHCNFEKIPGKILDNSMKHINVDLEYDTQKLYQRYYFKKDVMRVDYKSEHKRAKSNSNRIFFKSQRPQNLAATDLDLQKIDKGAKIASHFKGSNIRRNCQAQFYRDSGKELPSQTDMRIMNQMSNFWKEPMQENSNTHPNNNKLARPKLEYQQKKMKSDMSAARRQKIADSKRAKINQSQICADKYFRYYKK